MTKKSSAVHPSTARSMDRLSEQWWATRTPEVRARRCTAHRSDRSGQRCKNPALVFQNVCRYHGGASKNAKHAAQRRLGEALDIMAKGLLTIAESAESESVRLAAIKEVLNLGGINAKTSVEVDTSISLKPFEQILSGIAPLSREESRAMRGLPDTTEPASALVQDELAAMRNRNIIDAEVIEDDPETPANRPAKRRNPPRKGTGRPKRAQRRSDEIPPGYLDAEDALELAAEANRKAGALPSRRRGSRMRL